VVCERHLGGRVGQEGVEKEDDECAMSSVGLSRMQAGVGKVGTYEMVGGVAVSASRLSRQLSLIRRCGEEG
jgi:hypothetical protein